MDIRLIPSSEIDRLKWDSCVHYATQPAFSGYTWYLNAVSKDWVGLVEGDYESVLPLFVGKDWLSRTVHGQPHHLAPNGPFSIHVMGRPRMLEFLRALPVRSRNVLLAWEGQTGLAGVRTETVERFLLPLYDPAEDLLARIDLPSRGVSYRYGSPTPEKLSAFWLQHTPFHRQRDKDRYRYLRIMYQVLHRGQGFASSVESEAGQPLAMAFFVSSHNYLFRLLSASVKGDSGKDALRALYSGLIETNAGRPFVMDFNGDPMGGSFGATRLNYTLAANG